MSYIFVSHNETRVSPLTVGRASGLLAHSVAGLAAQGHIEPLARLEKSCGQPKRSLP
jgi:hypothetical protein